MAALSDKLVPVCLILMFQYLDLKVPFLQSPPLPSPQRGYFHQNRTWMCLPDLENLTFSIPIFCSISNPSVYHFLKEEHPILTKLGAFYNNLPQIHPIYVIWAPSSLMKNPDCNTKFREKAPQKAGTCIIHIPCQWSLPPPSL